MTELIVSIENPTMMADIKRAIRMVRGVAAVKVSKRSETPNAYTLKAFQEAENGDTIVCDNIDEYLKAVGYGIQD
ncbi:hypothetical protein [Xylanibacter rodentium]|uniref:hypothetical protein n=1 Tax=Xylanibacter rodentium TaxID=2736289 RepID=UPI00258BE0A9|nr:hypothetical protein [Xylanibacter rodentium]